MYVKYGDANTYKYKLEDEKMKWLVSKTNRSIGQTQFLFNLIDGDFNKLKELEEKIKNTFYYGCPSTLNEVEKILTSKNKSNKFRLDIF